MPGITEDQAHRYAHRYGGWVPAARALGVSESAVYAAGRQAASRTHHARSESRRRARETAARYGFDPSDFPRFAKRNIDRKGQAA